MQDLLGEAGVVPALIRLIASTDSDAVLTEAVHTATVMLIGGNTQARDRPCGVLHECVWGVRLGGLIECERSVVAGPTTVF